MNWRSVLLFAFASAPLACGGVEVQPEGRVFDDFEDGYLHDDVWQVLNYSETAEIREHKGQLQVSNLEGGWDGIGVRLVQPIDLTAGRLRIQFSAKSGTTETLCSLNHTPSEGDPYLDKPMSEWMIRDGAWQFWDLADGHTVDEMFALPVDPASYHTYLVVLAPTDDPQRYTFRTSVDEGALGQAHGTLDLQGGDPSEVWLYLHAAQETGPQTQASFFDDVTIESPSIDAVTVPGACHVGLRSS